MPETQPQPAPRPEEIHVELSRGDYLYYNWVLALERPVLPFLLYTFVLLNLTSLLGLFPAGRAFAAAALLSILLYAVWLTVEARALWRHHPQIAEPRRFIFGEETYRVTGRRTEEVPYAQVAQLLSSRRGLYLQRKSQTADLLPHRSMDDDRALHNFLARRVARVKRAKFL